MLRILSFTVPVQTVLVVGATGTQGGSVARQLLAADTDFQVHGLTRNPDSQAAENLREQGVTVVQGDLREQDSIAAMVEPVDTVFAMTDYWESGFDGEITQGINLARAVAAGNVKHVVFSSIAGAGSDSTVPMIETKAHIEREFRSLDVPVTILRPSYFMANFELRQEAITDGTLALPLASGIRLPILDVLDIGRLATRVFNNPEAYAGETIPLAGAELTLTEIASEFSTVLNRPVEPVHVPLDAALANAPNEYIRLFLWYNNESRTGIVQELTDAYDFTPTSLREYLIGTGWGEHPLESKKASVR